MVRSYKRLTDAESYSTPYDVWIIYDGNGGTQTTDGSKRKIVSDRYQLSDTFVSSQTYLQISTARPNVLPFVEWGTSISGGFTFGEKANVSISTVLGQFVDDPTSSARSDFFDYVYASDEDRKLDENEAMLAGAENTEADPFTRMLPDAVLRFGRLSCSPFGTTSRKDMSPTSTTPTSPMPERALSLPMLPKR